MGYFLLIAVEIISAVLITTATRTKQIPQKNSNVLGVQIAQDITPTDQPSPTDQDSPSPDTTPSGLSQPLDQTQTTTRDQSPQPTDMPTDLASPSPSGIDQTSQVIEKSPSPQMETEGSPASQSNINDSTTNDTTGSPSALANPNESPNPTPNADQLQFNTQLTVAINSEDLSTSSDYISSNTLEAAQNQDQILNNQITPQEQAVSLIKFTEDNTKSIDNLAKTDDFASSDFVAQRLSNQVSHVIQIIQNLPQNEAQTAKNKLTDVCQYTDSILRVSETTVPSDVEQDMEIARGTCDSVNR